MSSIQWARYKGKKGARYLLGFHLGVKNGKHYLLECDLVPNHEVEILKSLQPQLNILSLDQKITLIRIACPIAMRRAYRTIRHNNYELVQKY